MLSREQHQPGHQLSLEVDPARNQPGCSSLLLCWDEGRFLPDGHFGGTNALPCAGGPGLVQEGFVLATISVYGAGADCERLRPSCMANQARVVFLILGPSPRCSSCSAAEVLLASHGRNPMGCPNPPPAVSPGPPCPGWHCFYLLPVAGSSPCSPPGHHRFRKGVAGHHQGGPWCPLELLQPFLLQ